MDWVFRQGEQHVVNAVCFTRSGLAQGGELDWVSTVVKYLFLKIVENIRKLEINAIGFS